MSNVLCVPAIKYTWTKNRCRKKAHNRIMKKKLIELWETRLRSSCRHKTFNPSHAILNRLNIYWMCAVYEWVSVCMSKDWATGNQFDDERYSLLAMVIVASERDRDATTFESSPRTSINGRDGPTHIWNNTSSSHHTVICIHGVYGKYNRTLVRTDS